MTCGQKGQRDLSGKKSEGFMESLWETFSGTEYLGSPSTKSEGRGRVRQGCRDRRAQTREPCLHKLDLHLMEQGSHRGVSKLSPGCGHMCYFQKVGNRNGS